jgi:phosphatidate cytidylyltransferase
MVFLAVFIGFGTWELATISRTDKRHVPRIPILISALAMVPTTYYFGALGQLLTLAAGIGFTIVWHAIQRGLSKTTVTDRDMIMSAFTLAYVPFLVSFTLIMTARDGGEWWTLGTMIIIASIDTGAFATGLLFGRHPMAPKISPKKTWEGFAGSVVFALVAGYFIATQMIQIPWWWGMLFGLIMVGTATAGDLIESLIKRELGTKDASQLLPGHGGFLDRLDSVLPSMFVASVFAAFFS